MQECLVLPVDCRVEKKRWKRWTVEEDEYIRKHAFSKKWVDIARDLGRKDNSVRARAYQKGILKFPNWTEEEKQIIRDNYGKMRMEDIASLIGRSRDTVSIMANKLGYRTRRQKPAWTPEEDKIIRDNNTSSAAEISMLFNGYRTEKAIDMRRKVIKSPRVFTYPDKLYRKQVEWHRGYKLQPGEIVHHIDADRTNNGIENLIVVNRHDHLKAHKSFRRIVKQMLELGIIYFDRDTKEYVMKYIRE
jgi:hypothetical protein